MSAIELKNVTKCFDGKAVLKNINLTVKEGELVSLLGPSGCGKSTTLKLLAGLVAPDGGDILLGGSSILDLPIEKRGVVIVFQSYLLFPHLTVEQNVEFGLKMQKIHKNSRRERAQRMIELVQLRGYERKYPMELSGGQQQRVAIARALAVEPRVLLLDEPFSNLDLRLRESMREFVCDLQRQVGITTILVTHDKEEALMTSDRIAVMLDGEIKQVGTPKQVYGRPVSPEVADFFGEANYVHGVVAGGVLQSLIPIPIPVHIPDGKVKVMVKPEDVTLTPVSPERLKGTIQRERYAGERIYYTVDVAGMDFRCVAPHTVDYEVGDEVGLDIDFSKAVYYPM